MRLQIRLILSILQALPYFSFIYARFYCLVMSLDHENIGVVHVFNGVGLITGTFNKIKRSGTLSNTA